MVFKEIYVDQLFRRRTLLIGTSITVLLLGLAWLGLAPVYYVLLWLSWLLFGAAAIRLCWGFFVDQGRFRETELTALILMSAILAGAAARWMAHRPAGQPDAASGSIANSSLPEVELTPEQAEFIVDIPSSYLGDFAKAKYEYVAMHPFRAPIKEGTIEEHSPALAAEDMFRKLETGYQDGTMILGTLSNGARAIYMSDIDFDSAKYIDLQIMANDATVALILNCFESGERSAELGDLKATNKVELLYRNGSKQGSVEFPAQYFGESESDSGLQYVGIMVPINTPEAFSKAVALSFIRRIRFFSDDIPLVGTGSGVLEVDRLDRDKLSKGLGFATFLLAHKDARKRFIERARTKEERRQEDMRTPLRPNVPK